MATNGSIEGQTISLRAVWGLVCAMLAGAVYVGGVVFSIKLEVSDAASEVRHVRERIDEIAHSIDGLGDLKADVKLMHADLARLQTDVDGLKRGAK